MSEECGWRRAASQYSTLLHTLLHQNIMALHVVYRSAMPPVSFKPMTLVCPGHMWFKPDSRKGNKCLSRSGHQDQTCAVMTLRFDLSLK